MVYFPNFALVGFARRDWEDQDFAQIVRLGAGALRTPFHEDVWQQLSEGIRFVAGDLDDPAAFDQLAAVLGDLDQLRGTGGNHAFYFSIPPRFFATVVKQLKRSGLSDSSTGAWRRVVIEKPFGHDLKSAQELNSIVDEVFAPSSVFRIDHYLGRRPSRT